MLFRSHTALKIAPQYEGGVVHVLDASRSVSVAGSLLNQQKTAFLSTLSNDYEKLRQEFANKKTSKEMLGYEAAVKNKTNIDWGQTTFTVPTFTGHQLVNDISIETLIPYIDWTPFFIAWELHGKYPAILSDSIIGAEATKLHKDAMDMLDMIAAQQWLTPKAVLGFWPANSNDKDSVEILDTHTNEKIELQFLRQQLKKAEGRSEEHTSELQSH